MLIIGAGMSGLLAAQYFRSHQPTIIEKQSSLPNNHHALLRFRSKAVSDLTGIRFKKVSVDKAIWYDSYQYTDPNPYLNNLYSYKVTGEYSNRSILNLDTAERFIAPKDFVSRLSKGLDIHYNQDADSVIPNENKTPTISTMPVGILAKLLNYDLDANLVVSPIWTMSCDIELPKCDLYQTIYLCDPTDGSYRVSITGDRLIVEGVNDPHKAFPDPIKMLDNLSLGLLNQFGIVAKVLSNLEVNHSKYGKLIPCKTDEVKDFISWATKEHNIYSLGRWATHRQILMDDVANDLKVIDNMIHSNNYER